MTTPPLPESPCVRVRLDYTQSDNFLAGSRFFLSYAGGAPTPGNCTTLAGDVAAAWATHIAPNVIETYALTEVDVLDITSLTGASGQWTGSNAGGESGTQVPASAAVNVEFGIARRYRGGKPRMFIVPPDTSAFLDAGHWSADFTAATQTAVEGFFTELAGLTVGAMGTLAHVNVSYYAGFTNITNSSGRTRAVPKYRDAAVLDNVESYAVKAEIGSQRRRRIATTY